MSTPDLKDHIALITGATGGIGKATCRALASLGCSIAVHYNSNSEAAEALVKELRDKGVRANAFQADLRQYDQVCIFHDSHTQRTGAVTTPFPRFRVNANDLYC